MSSVIALTPALQRFAWGSADDLPDLLGFESDGEPYAEAWWGAHPHAPALTSMGPLDALVASDPVRMLGEQCSATFGQLPFLLKVLAIAQPLSIQVHPPLARAIDGFALEEAQGRPLDDPARTYKDASHKPEMLVALSELTLLSGFREPAEIVPDLLAVGGDDARHLASLLLASGVHAYVDAALSERHLDAVSHLADYAGEGSLSLSIARDALRIHPNDPGALVALAMNAVVLQPGEALYTPSGVVHCYVNGLGVEIMANSDNVVRAGFTSKTVNADLLRELATLEPTEPVRPDVALQGAAQHLTTDADEFQLSVVRDGPAVAESGPRIVVALAGEAEVRTSEESRVLGKGEAVFIPAGEGPATLQVNGFAVVASARASRH